MAIAATLQKEIRIGGEVLGGNQSFSEATGQITEYTLPAGKPGALSERTGTEVKAGTLSTRTDDDEGVVTLTAEHGITTGMVVDVSWTLPTAGARLGMDAVVDVNDVTVEGGTGDVLPDEDSVMGLCEASAGVVTLAGGSGTLSTRTDDNTGVVTLSAGHGIETDMVVDVSWTTPTPGSRLGMTATTVTNDVTVEGGAGDALPTEDGAVILCEEHGIATGNKVNVSWSLPTEGVHYGMLATVAANEVTVDGGMGDVLPAATSLVVLCKQTVIERELDAADIALIGVQMNLRGHIEFHHGGDALTIAGVNCAAGVVWEWDEQSGLANPASGQVIGEFRLGNAVAASNPVKLAVLVNDVQ